MKPRKSATWAVTVPLPSLLPSLSFRWCLPKATGDVRVARSDHFGSVDQPNRG